MKALVKMMSEQPKKVIRSPQLSNVLQENIFGLEQPEQLNCKVWDYTVSHKVLTIYVADENFPSSRQVIFEMVHYFSGPTRWQSAKFDLLPLQSALEMAKDFEIYEGHSLEEESPESLVHLLSACRVYRVQINNQSQRELLICAGKADYLEW